ncbi:hypothetical protein H5410_022092 [Solanum commersonii]|uniref:Uncharacterized protein n=1 Tax=Solanum commersonii TaxID=4109 RepID=A0A9J5ZCX5_SOLCO|nr:hypothetical protein H5410_022092 [Solanum commersonii]
MVHEFYANWAPDAISFSDCVGCQCAYHTRDILYAAHSPWCNGLRTGGRDITNLFLILTC